MRKIISLFQRNYGGDRLVRDEVVPGAEWVIAGEGTPTRKFDGTCCMVRGNKLYKRYDAKLERVDPKRTAEALHKGGIKFANDLVCIPVRPIPEGFEPAQDPDPVTYHWAGWLPVGDGPEDKWHRETYAIYEKEFGGLPDGAYELIGPKIQGNAEAYKSHSLVLHGLNVGIDVSDCPRSFDAIKEWFKTKDIEGIVWHHPDGRMVKIKKRDFGLKRKP